MRETILSPVAPQGFPGQTNLIDFGFDGFPDPYHATPALELLKSATFFIDAANAKTGDAYAFNQGTGGFALDARYGSSLAIGAADTNDPLLLPWTGENYVYLPGVTGNRAFTPDAAPLKITGDIDIVVRVALDDWTPAAANALCAKESSSTARSYRLHVTSSSALAFVYAADGTTAVTATSTISLSVTDGSTYWVRATRASGSGNVNFYYAADQATEPTTWTQLGTTVLGATGALFDSTSVVEVGTVFGGGSLLSAGKFYRAIVRNGIDGTIVFDADFTTGVTSGSQATFTESSSNAATVTINRSTAGRKASAVTRNGWLFGTDDYMEVADNALLNMDAAQSFTVVAVVRQWDTPASGIMINKISPGAVGWRLQNNVAALQFVMANYDGTIINSSNTSVATSGALSLVSAIASASEYSASLNILPSALKVARTTASLSTVNPLRIGCHSSVATAFTDFELLAVAIFRRALTATEIATINTYYGTA